MRLNKRANLYLAKGTRLGGKKCTNVGRIQKPDGAPANRPDMQVKLRGVFCRSPMSHASVTNGLPDMKTPSKTHRVIDP
jgi:hypothetical protein